MRASLYLTGLLLACGLSANCATHAQQIVAVAEPPGLDAPEPPGRVVLPPTEQPTLPAPVEENPAGTTPTSPTRVPNRNPTPRPATPPPAEPPPAPAPTPGVLLTSANTAEFEQRVNKQLVLAQEHLKHVNRQNLGADGQAHFDAANGFIRQAQEALKVKNFIYAGQLADKAATMAAALRK